MQTRKRISDFFPVFIALASVSFGPCRLSGQDTAPPWRSRKISPKERPKWFSTAHAGREAGPFAREWYGSQSSVDHALTPLSNGGAGYVEGVPRLGIPPLVISDPAYGVREAARMDDTRLHYLPTWEPPRAGIDFRVLKTFDAANNSWNLARRLTSFRRTIRRSRGYSSFAGSAPPAFCNAAPEKHLDRRSPDYVCFAYRQDANHSQSRSDK